MPTRHAAGTARCMQLKRAGQCEASAWRGELSDWSRRTWESSETCRQTGHDESAQRRRHSQWKVWSQTIVTMPLREERRDMA